MNAQKYAKKEIFTHLSEKARKVTWGRPCGVNGTLERGAKGSRWFRCLPGGHTSDWYEKEPSTHQVELTGFSREFRHGAPETRGGDAPSQGVPQR